MVEACDTLFDLDDWSRSCSYKKGYRSEWDAKYAADECERRQPRLRLSWYQCRYCGLWHLTERRSGR